MADINKKTLSKKGVKILGIKNLLFPSKIIFKVMPFKVIIITLLQARHQNFS